jgi:moderate conductance mechanosensitive channel
LTLSLARFAPARLPFVPRLALLSLVLCLAALPGRSWAADSPAAPAISADEARHVLSVLQDPARRRDFIDTLQAIAAGLPVVSGAAAAPAAPAATKPPEAPPSANPAAPGPPAANATAPAPPAANAATAPPSAKPGAPPQAAAPAPAKNASLADHLKIPLQADSLGAELLADASSKVAAVANGMRHGLDFQEQARALGAWVGITWRDSWVRQQIPRLLWEIALILGCGIAADYLLGWALRRPRRALLNWAETRLRIARASRADAGADPETRRQHVAQRLFLRRLPALAGYFVLEFLPTQAFALVVFILFSLIIPNNQVDRLTIGAIANAYLITRLIMSGLRVLLIPDSDALRPFRLTSPQAVSVLQWLLRLVATVTVGHAIIRVCLVFGLSLSAQAALVKLVVLVVHLLALAMIIRERAAITNWLRPLPGAKGARLRGAFARSWYLVAVFYLVAVWIVRVLDIPHAFEEVIRLIVVTAVVIGVARFLTLSGQGLIGRLASPAEEDEPPRSTFRIRLRRYEALMRGGVAAIILAFAIFALLQGWGLDPWGWLTSGPLGGRIASALVNVIATFVAALVAWELANAGLGHRIDRLEREGKRSRAARLRTLLPMLRTALIVVFAIVLFLVALSEIGVNIAPLLAGAGVIGIAVGFGSQKLVQDLINGLFLLLEDAVQVGDVVSLAGLTGVVEHLSIRSIRLRSEDGSVHLVPFSAVSSVTNMTRDFAYAVAKLTVSYSEDPDEVMGALRDIVAEMRREPAWQPLILTDIEMQGVDNFGERGLTINCRIRTGPFSRGAVAREFNRRIQHRFARMGVEMSAPRRPVEAAPAAVEREAAPVGVHIAPAG